MPICVERAVELSRAAAAVLEEEQVPLPQALGRTLRRPVFAPFPQPPFDRSPLDGYALRAADIVSASEEMPALLRVAEKVCAGQVPSRPLAPGQAVRVMTGAMLPAGADCVIRQEDTDLGEERVRIFHAAAAGENRCLAGEEYAAGTLLLALAVVVIGGLRSIYGTVIGALIVFAVPDLILKRIPVIGKIDGIAYIFTGVLIILVIMFYPNGVVGIGRDIKRLFGRGKTKNEKKEGADHV